LTSALTVGRDIHLPENKAGSGGRTFDAIQSGRSIFEKAQDRPDPLGGLYPLPGTKRLKRRKGSYTDVEAALSNVYVVKKTVVKPMQHSTVTLRAAEVEQKTTPAGDCVVTGSIKFMDTNNLHPWIDALTKVGEDGWLIAAVMNSTEEEITIQPGTCYGTISLTANGHQA
jgi:hypothetical protein